MFPPALLAKVFSALIYTRLSEARRSVLSSQGKQSSRCCKSRAIWVFYGSSFLLPRISATNTNISQWSRPLSSEPTEQSSRAWNPAERRNLRAAQSCQVDLNLSRWTFSLMQRDNGQEGCFARGFYSSPNPSGYPSRVGQKRRKWQTHFLSPALFVIIFHGDRRSVCVLYVDSR